MSALDFINARPPLSTTQCRLRSPAISTATTIGRQLHRIFLYTRMPHVTNPESYFTGTGDDEEDEYKLLKVEIKCEKAIKYSSNIAFPLLILYVENEGEWLRP